MNFSKKKFLFSSFVGIFLFSSFLFYSFLPNILETYHSYQAFQKAGLSIQTKCLPKESFEYAESGKGSLLICLHGFRGNKSSYCPHSSFFKKNFHVVAVDLPGHGGTLSPEDQHYDLLSLAKSIHRFVEANGWKQFHLLGTSLGGGIAVQYAALYPEEVKSLILFNPLGVQFPQKSDLQKTWEEEKKNVLFPQTLEDFDRLFLYLTGKPLDWPIFLKKYSLKKMAKTDLFFKKAFQELLQSSTLEPLLSKIQTPTLLFASGKDRILPPSSYEVFKRIPHLHYTFFPEGTHVLTGETLQKALQEAEKFLKSQDP